MTALATRIAAVPRPAPRISTIVSYGTIILILGLGVWSFIALDYSLKSLDTTIGNVNRFITMATPLQWPGWDVTAEVGAGGAKIFTTTWVGFEPIWQMVLTIVITLALVISGTALAAVLSIPVAYGAARNTSPNSTVLALCRGIGVVTRAIPDVVLVVFLAMLWFNSGTLAAIVAVGVHSVGMISKMFADAIEQIDEGPRLAIRSAGGSKSQQFWSGIVPQVLPAWVAVTLHRADINLRASVILGVVGVVGLGYELDGALHGGAAGMRRVIPIVVIIIALCVVFEIVSSVLRTRLMGVKQTGKSIGDTVSRAVSRRKVDAAASTPAQVKTLDRNVRIEAAMHRPWNRERIGNTLWVWLGVILVVASFIYAAPDVTKIFTPSWSEIVSPERDRAIWPPNFGGRSWGDVMSAVLVTLQIAFAATLMATIISAIVGPLSARNVAPNGAVRNFFRGVALFIRAIPDLVVAILFIIAAGIGPQAGALALGIGGVGLMAKLIGDSMEEVPNGPERALAAAGGTRAQVFFSSTVPMSVPAMVGHLMYLLEQNIRSATLLGIVGAGGIGFLVLNALNGRHFDEVLAYVLVIIAMVVVVEGVSILIRRALK